MHPEKYRLDQIQNGGLSAIIYFHMTDTVDLVIFARF